MANKSMTVGELITRLQQFSKDMEVVVQSYEEGLDPITDVEQVDIIDYPEP